MLKKRIIATLVVRDGIVVQSIGFKKYLPVGKPDIAIDFLNQWGIDEIVLLDISAAKNKNKPNFELIKKAAKKCYVPLTVGGGITKIEHIRELMHYGADKICINQAVIHHPELISHAARIFGNQCVVVSIDAILVNDKYRVYDHVEKKAIDISPAQLAQSAEQAGAGEILINSIDRDGSYSGFDTKLINEICNLVSIPVICAGGAKNANDFKEVFLKTNVSAASASNFFHFTEHSVNTTKAALEKKLKIRLETHANYSGVDFDAQLRLQKRSDKYLEDLLYVKIENEII